MRNFVIIFFISASCYSQPMNYEIYVLTFDDTAHYGRLFIDTISFPNNIWQIGTPYKNIFNMALSPPNAIITDTINPYPINDTSAFIITHRASLALSLGQKAILSGFYKVDTDSLEDFGKIELSPDNGITWFDMIDDQSFFWNSKKPVLTGKSDWSYFSVSFDDLGYNLDFGDTVLFRFTFISGSNQHNKDGLMFDDLDFFDCYEGIFSNIIAQFESVIYPNPCTNSITIEFENSKFENHELRIFNWSGKIIQNIDEINFDRVEIDISNFPSGTYIYRLVNRKLNQASCGKFIVN